MPSFHQPRPRPGFLIDTSSSMEDSQLARALAELAGLTRQLGYGADVVVACCDAAVRDVRKVFGAGQVELCGGGGTDLDVGLRAFIERTHDPIDLLVIVSDCHDMVERCASVSRDHHPRRRRRRRHGEIAAAIR